MEIRVILTLLSGGFEQGFAAMLRIRADNSTGAEQEYSGKLPPAPDLPDLFEQWQSAFRQRVKPYQPRIKSEGVKQFSVKRSGNQLEHRLNAWLDAHGEWQTIRDALMQNLNSGDRIRLIVQSEDPIIPRLPWHLWRAFFDRYLQAEVAIALSNYQPLAYSTPTQSKVRILAVFGEAEDIDLTQDRQFLANLQQSNAEVHFEQPNRQQLTQLLGDEQGWDILFFAGHSSSKNGIGEINIGYGSSRYGFEQTSRDLHSVEQNRLEINDLKYALTQARSRLHLAIFNSCDGSGIGNALLQLNIPQTIIMREPVPDRLAQAFLKHFLGGYTSGKSLYASVRAARENLQAIEDQIPYASWMPMIYQNPAIAPLTWRQLGGYYAPESEDLMVMQRGKDYVQLRDYLANGDWQQADCQTGSIILKSVAKKSDGWLDVNAILSLSSQDLSLIDYLWLKYSNKRFGFSIQKQIWQAANQDPLAFGDWLCHCACAARIGWRSQNHWLRSYSDFTFSLAAPVGHLPCFAKWCSGWRLWHEVFEQEFGLAGQIFGWVLLPGYLMSSDTTAEKQFKIESTEALMSKLIDFTGSL